MLIQYLKMTLVTKSAVGP